MIPRPTKDQALAITNAAINKQEAAQLKHIFREINNTAAQGLNNFVFHEDVNTNVAGVLKGMGYTLVFVGGRNDEQFYQIAWL